MTTYARSDEELLTDPRAFGEFYARHLPGVERYFARRLGDREAAADLAAETFAAALLARRRFAPGEVPAAGWLYTIAARRLVDHHRRRGAEARAHAALALERRLPPARDDSPLGLLRHLPPEQRAAIAAHVLEGRGYDELAAETGHSAAAVRQRVSRGLRALQQPLRVYRAAQAVAREDRAYRFGGGHGVGLDEIAAGDPLDCSASASLVLARAGLFGDDVAWPSGRFAEEWGEPGEGRHFTVWAVDGHVWLEFKLGRRERFDPTPPRLARGSGRPATGAHATHDFVPRHWPGL